MQLAKVGEKHPKRCHLTNPVHRSRTETLEVMTKLVVRAPVQQLLGSIVWPARFGSRSYLADLQAACFRPYLFHRILFLIFASRILIGTEAASAIRPMIVSAMNFAHRLLIANALNFAPRRSITSALNSVPRLLIVSEQNLASRLLIEASLAFQ